MNKKWLAILLMATGIFSCRKAEFGTVQPKGKSIPITVAIDESRPSYRIPSDFEGLSYETGLLGEDPEFLNANNTVLIQLIKNLGNGILRIGGNTSDETSWTGLPRKDNTPKNLLTTSDIDRLSAFSKAIGWRVLFGLNLGDNNPTAAGNEAMYVYNSLQKDLYAFQSGNEPDVFKFHLREPGYNYADYQHEWNGYFDIIKSLVPNAHFAGPDADPFDPNWVSAFARNEQKNIRLIDGHYYSTGPASNPSISYSDILKPNDKLITDLLQLSKISAYHHLPYRISECNSVWGGGKPGVSDVFASSLWALDFMWTVAENKGQGINFHGGPPRFAYSPITMNNSTVTARPEYYAMLAFKYGSNGGSIIPAIISDPRSYNNCSVYACAGPDNATLITLINKEESKDFAFTIQLSKKASTMIVDRLTAPSIASTTSITFAGSTVTDSGLFSPSSTLQMVNSKSFVVTVPAGSAAVITVR